MDISNEETYPSHDLEAELTRRNANWRLKYMPDYIRIQKLAAAYWMTSKEKDENWDDCIKRMAEKMGQFEAELQKLCLSHEELRKRYER